MQHRKYWLLIELLLNFESDYNLAVFDSIQKSSHATVFMPNRELPLGYFCSVTPP
jgi:hypothetical protein